MVLGNISLQECLVDSPIFRQHVSRFEEHSEVLRKRYAPLPAARRLPVGRLTCPPWLLHRFLSP